MVLCSGVSMRRVQDLGAATSSASTQMLCRRPYYLLRQPELIPRDWTFLSGQPLGTGHVSTKTDDRGRHGTLSWFVAPSCLDGKIVCRTTGCPHQRKQHRAEAPEDHAVTKPEQYSWEGMSCRSRCIRKPRSERGTGRSPLKSDGRWICGCRSSQHDRPNGIGPAKDFPEPRPVRGHGRSCLWINMVDWRLRDPTDDLVHSASFAGRP